MRYLEIIKFGLDVPSVQKYLVVHLIPVFKHILKEFNGKGAGAFQSYTQVSNVRVLLGWYR